MTRERIAWTVGTLLCVGMAVRFVGSAPLDADDRAFATLISRVEHEVKNRYVEEISPAQLRQMREGAIRGMLNVLDPQHYTVYVPPAQGEMFMQAIEGTLKGIGVTLDARPNGEIAVLTPLDGSPAYAAGLEAGDVFVAVNGESVVGFNVADLRSRIVGEPGTTVNLTMRRYDGSTKDFTVERGSINLPTVMGYNRNPDGTWNWFADDVAKVAYIRIDQFNKETAEKVQKALKQINEQGGKGVVLDVRFNGGGLLDQATQIADFFLDSGVIVSVKGRDRPDEVTRANADDTLFRGPAAILINDDSASASEILAGALADHQRAAVVGTRSFGKGSVQELEDWGEDGHLKITVAKWHLPSGRILQRYPDSTVWGVDPTVEVKLSDEEYAELGKDIAEGAPIPPASHPTTRPARFEDRQLDVAVKAVKTQIGLDKSL